MEFINFTPEWFLKKQNKKKTNNNKKQKKKTKKITAKTYFVF